VQIGILEGIKKGFLITKIQNENRVLRESKMCILTNFHCRGKKTTVRKRNDEPPKISMFGCTWEIITGRLLSNFILKLVVYPIKGISPASMVVQTWLGKMFRKYSTYTDEVRN